MKSFFFDLCRTDFVPGRGLREYNERVDISHLQSFLPEFVDVVNDVTVRNKAILFAYNAGLCALASAPLIYACYRAYEILQ